MNYQEFKELSTCIKNTNGDKFEYIKSEVPILVYGKPKELSQTAVYKNSNYTDTLAPEQVFEELICNNNNSVFIKMDGQAVFGKYLKYDYKNEFGIEEKVCIGFFDKTANFIRYSKTDQNFRYHKIESGKIKSGTLQDISSIGFAKAYQESQTLELLFNEKGEPIDDYLQTCKNSDGKIVFDIFKE